MSSLQLDLDYLTEEEKQLQFKYQTGFNNSCYLAQYTGLDKKTHKFALTSFHHVFGNGYAKGDSLLEVGCGPTVHSLISASRHFKYIISSDFLESNRDSVLKWLKNEPNAHDWSPVFKHVAFLEKEEDYHKLEERVRKSMMDVIHCDILKTNPIAPVKMRFDCIVTSYCIANATTDFASYNKAVGNVANLLNPGGTLVMVGELNNSFYYVGNIFFPVRCVTKEAVLDSFLAAKLDVVYWSAVPILHMENHDCSTVFVAVAKK